MKRQHSSERRRTPLHSRRVLTRPTIDRYGVRFGRRQDSIASLGSQSSIVSMPISRHTLTTSVLLSDSTHFDLSEILCGSEVLLTATIFEKS